MTDLATIEAAAVEQMGELSGLERQILAAIVADGFDQVNHAVPMLRKIRVIVGMTTITRARGRKLSREERQAAWARLERGSAVAEVDQYLQERFPPA